MIKQILSAFFFIVMLYTVTAQQSSSLMIIDVPNIEPNIISIGLYSSNRYSREETVFTPLRQPDVFIKVEVEDGNGYSDLAGVKIKLTKLTNDKEETFDRFGANFADAQLYSGDGTKALYTYRYTMLPQDPKTTYRVTVEASDGKEVAQATKQFTFAEDINNPPVGFAVRNLLINPLRDFFRSLFSRFR